MTTNKLVQSLRLFMVSQFQHSAHFGGLLHQFSQLVAVQHREERCCCFVQHALQTARRKEPARTVGLASVLYHSVRSLAKSDDVPQSNLFRWPSEREAASDAALRLEVTIAAKVMHDFHQVMARNAKHVGDLVHGNPDNYTPPEWACNTFRALYDGLERLEKETHQHVHKENNVLFVKALAAA